MLLLLCVLYASSFHLTITHLHSFVKVKESEARNETKIVVNYSNTAYQNCVRNHEQITRSETSKSAFSNATI